MQICSVPECERQVHCRGWCKLHYERWRIHGRLDLVSREERFLRQIEVDSRGCWLWTGTLSHNGYGRFIESSGRGWQQRVPAHRWAYERWVGPVPSGLELDHFACDTPRCANPDHVRPVTGKENRARSRWVFAVNARKTHCVHGHPLSGDNLYITPNGRRQCKACRRAAVRAYQQRSA